jgi:hypothetical protein
VLIFWDVTSADWQICTNILEKLAASIFRVVFVEQNVISTSSKQFLFVSGHIEGSCVSYRKNNAVDVESKFTLAIN